MALTPDGQEIETDIGRDARRGRHTRLTMTRRRLGRAVSRD
jgi:hypothetical protein